MSEQVNPVPAEDRDASSGLLLSVEPLESGEKLYATDTTDGGADADVTGADTDTTDASDADGTDLLSDSDGTDAGDTDGSDADGSDLTDKVKDALGMDGDSDGSDGGTIRADTDGTDR
ncbi:MAG TPA: hypothetical protein VJS44_15900 [Pyrinomonadaceae bacterium]|nr:hypothetical protein [Pyrinomonadaceae bacterium]